MPIFLIPVMNGILPRPGGGRALGGFFAGAAEQALPVEPGEQVFVCPFVPASGSLYRIGVLAKIVDMRRQLIEMPGKEPVPFLAVVLEGNTHARWDAMSAAQGALMVDGLERMDFRQRRSDYPVVSGAGWIPQGGFTEFRSMNDIPVTLYGHDVEDNSAISMTANLRGLVGMEAAHTVEHAMIRSLRTYGLCSARTLQEAMRDEAHELTWSVEKSMRYALPEILGNTQAGACGNPMTNMAQFYMFQEMTEQCKGERNWQDARSQARRTVMSRLTADLGLTTEPEVRALQGLKKGMRHDDSPLSVDLCKRILARFPLEPWQ